MNCVTRGGSYLVNSCCDLQEVNRWKRESYEACWLSLVLETRPQYKMTVSEMDSVRRESYKQQQVVHWMVERSLSQTLMLGSGGVMTKHRLPLLNSSRAPHPDTNTFGIVAHPVASEEEMDDVIVQEKANTSLDLSKPVRENFRASSLMSSPRQISHRMQRRE